MSRIIKLQNVLVSKNMEYNLKEYKRVNNILFLLDEAIFSVMDLNVKISRLVMNDSNEILNAIRRCPTCKDFIFNSYMLPKLKSKANNKIRFLNIDDILISIKDLSNIFITVHDNYKAHRIIEPKFYNTFHRKENILDYIINIYELNNSQKKIFFKILDSITSISEDNIKLANSLFSELQCFNYDNIQDSNKTLGDYNYKKEKYYILKLLEMKDLMENKNLLKAIKNKVTLFQKYKKITENLVSLLPLSIIDTYL